MKHETWNKNNNNNKKAKDMKDLFKHNKMEKEKRRRERITKAILKLKRKKEIMRKSPKNSSEFLKIKYIFCALSPVFSLIQIV